VAQGFLDLGGSRNDGWGGGRGQARATKRSQTCPYRVMVVWEETVPFQAWPSEGSVWFS
jgi:hypothetical protein